MSRRPDPESRAARVLHIIPGLRVGGAEHVLHELLAGGSAKFRPGVLSLHRETTLRPLFERSGIVVSTLGMVAPWPDPRAAFRLHRLVRVSRPDLVVGWMYHGNAVAKLARRMLGRTLPVVWNVRHTPGELAEHPLSTRWAIRFGARWSSGVESVVYNSRRSAERHAELGYPPVRARVIPNGVDCRRFRPDSGGRSEVRQQLGLREDTFLLARIGRAHPMKDFPLFLRASAPLVHEVPRLSLLLAGPGVDVHNSALRAEIDALGLQRRVSLLGSVSRMPRLLAGIDVLCSSSRFGEGFPNVVAEAMATGIPCVVTDVGDSAALVADTGRVVPPGQIEAMTQALRELLSLPAEQRYALGRAARERTLAEFSWETARSRHERVWGDAIADHGRA